MTDIRPGFRRALVWIAVGSFGWGCWAAETNASRFGFTGPEIFPIENQISQLHVADLDGDGLNDIVVVDNASSHIDLLYNQTGKTNAAKCFPAQRKPELNELPPDARFHLESIASEKRIWSLVVADLNGDGRPDLAYYGEPKELVVVYNQGTNGWSAPKHWALDDGQLSPNSLCAGDLNHSGRTGLVLLGDTCIYYLPQRKDHTLGEPQKIPFSGTVKSLQVVDIDGDGLSDLLLVNWEDRNPFRFRLQQKDGSLGPEMYFSSAPIRSYWADNLEANKKTDVITIAQNSGRAQVSEFTRQPAEALSGCLRQGQFQVLPLNRTDRARRGVLWADINGDGLPDLLVAEPESGQVSVSFQHKDGSLSAPKTFPTLAGVTDLAAADWNDDGKAELFMLSADERQVGVTHLDDKERLPFPTLIPLDGKPLAMAVGRLQAGAKPVLAMIVEQEGRGGLESRRLLITRTADGKTRSQRLSRDFKSNPTTLAFHDVDQDGLTDLIVLSPFEKVKVLRQVPGKDFEELDVEPPGGAIEQPWLATADIDGDGKPELLLPQKNFLRAVVLQREPKRSNTASPGDWTLTVKEQINGAGSNSRLVAAAAIPAGTNGIPSLFLLDAERKVLTLCERDASGVWQVVRNVPLPVSDFARLQPVALGGTKINALAFLGLNSVAYLPFSGEVWELTALDSYETPIKDGRLTDVVSGDLDNDGRKDLVFLETARNYLDLVIFDAHHKLIPANRWQVFEERTFRSRRNDLPEPREAVVADVTGDGKNDLIVLVHDRILVYPQE
ncbi:MAG TPA: VCBS repeat-containing protein [Candidatus Acidoferrum sp.]|nr:VCBS repeat-containing protein [Candidatus Acidoferrum sp.]